MMLETRKPVRCGETGFSLVESVTALALGAAIIAGVMASWYYSSNVWKEETLKIKLRYDLETALERIRDDIRLSDGNVILYHPSGASTYTAISVPRSTPGVNGFLSFSSDAISWDHVIVYHVHDAGEKVELRRTTIDSYSASQATRQTQLESVVADGDGSSVGGSPTTRTLYSAEDASLEITPEYPTYDGYASAVSRSETVSFGSIKLAPGTHQIRFEVMGKNSASTGFGVGIDSISLSPSGCEREAEALTISASSDPAASEDMTAVGNEWGGNHSLQLSAGAAGDYVEFDIDYDEWLESNFVSFSRSKLVIEGSDPHLTTESRELQGLSPAWQAEAQTGVETTGGSSLSDVSVRTVVSGSLISTSADMVRFKFLAPSTSSLAISSAYFGVRAAATGDFSGAPAQLYFNNGTVEEGEDDGVGALGAAGPTSIVIPAGHHAWSNWFEYTVDASGGSVPDHLISVHVPSGSSEAAVWTPTDLGAVNTYTVDGDHAADLGAWNLLPGYAVSAPILGCQQAAFWTATGTAVSPIYDTQVTSPAYDDLTWSAVIPAGATVTLQARTSSDPAMSGAADWSTLPTYTSTPASLGALANNRYLQYRAILTAASPYTDFPELDDIKINWPGRETLVEIGGHYTLKPNQGVFRVLVDGNPTVKGLEVRLGAKEAYKGKTVDLAVKGEVRPQNTGK